MVVYPVQAAGYAVRALQEIRAPDRLSDADRPGRVDGADELAGLEHPDLEADSALGTLLTLEWRGVDGVDVADDDADPVESEELKHATIIARAATAGQRKSAWIWHVDVPVPDN
jgi:hypothetical protein